MSFAPNDRDAPDPTIMFCSHSGAGSRRAREPGRSAGFAPFTRSPLPPGRDSTKFLHELMTRDQVQTAINEGIPFDIKMADGAKYRVRERYQVAVGRTSVVVFDDKDLAHILPLTGITYLKPNSKH